MIEQFFWPESVKQALELKRQFQDEAVYFGGGSKLNATPTKTTKKFGIALSKLGLDKVSLQQGKLHIGSQATLQRLIDTPLIPDALRNALGFIYSRHLRNQATLAGEMIAKQKERVLLPVLLVLDALVVTAAGETISLEEYLDNDRDDLLLEVILPDPYQNCSTRKIARSAAGLAVITAAVATGSNGEMKIALDGVSERAIRLRDVESRGLSDDKLEKAVSDAISPRADIGGSEAYKRYIAGVVVAELLADCQQMSEEK
ncbi:oxidoreductase [Hafnia alvei]|uniref:molybdopterin-dependent oxidoreductase FAD-binding subunit n=1 Tax=Hafnia alvei TaxID=569 RepID=UPI00058376B1|nr:molybdopterin-dependent oxidoreductase FAD-binding subunit [Hafnia alvei]KID03692.1 oxidoreductase [Hafnia alvei]